MNSTFRAYDQQERRLNKEDMLLLYPTENTTATSITLSPQQPEDTCTCCQKCQKNRAMIVTNSRTSINNESLPSPSLPRIIEARSLKVSSPISSSNSSFFNEDSTSRNFPHHRPETTKTKIFKPSTMPPQFDVLTLDRRQLSPNSQNKFEERQSPRHLFDYYDTLIYNNSSNKRKSSYEDFTNEKNKEVRLMFPKRRRKFTDDFLDSTNFMQRRDVYEQRKSRYPSLGSHNNSNIETSVQQKLSPRNNGFEQVQRRSSTEDSNKAFTGIYQGQKFYEEIGSTKYYTLSPYFNNNKINNSRSSITKAINKDVLPVPPNTNTLTPLSPPSTPPSQASSPPLVEVRRENFINLTESSNGNSFDSASSLSGSEEETETLDNKTHKKHVERAKYERTIKLYKFLIDLLEETHPCVMWINRESGVFKITDSEKLAQLWGEVKLNASMTYEKLARSFRHYYKKGILDSGEKVISPVSRCGKKKLYYKFSAATLKRFLDIEAVE